MLLARACNLEDKFLKWRKTLRKKKICIRLTTRCASREIAFSAIGRLRGISRGKTLDSTRQSSQIPVATGVRAGSRLARRTDRAYTRRVCVCVFIYMQMQKWYTRHLAAFLRGQERRRDGREIEKKKDYLIQSRDKSKTNVARAVTEINNAA